MIVGIGTDLLDSRRIEKIVGDHPTRFLEKYFTPAEVEIYHQREKAGTHILYLTSRFAAKEAAAKALGTGFQDGLSMSDVEVSNDDKGKPILSLHGQAQERLQSLMPEGTKANIHLTITDEAPYAQAFVIIEAI